MTLEFFTIDIFQDQNILPSLIFMYNDHTFYFLEVSYYKQKFHVHCGARWPINEWDVICKGAGCYHHPLLNSYSVSHWESYRSRRRPSPSVSWASGWQMFVFWEKWLCVYNIRTSVTPSTLFHCQYSHTVLKCWNEFNKLGHTEACKIDFFYLVGLMRPF